MDSVAGGIIATVVGGGILYLLFKQSPSPAVSGSPASVPQVPPTISGASRGAAPIQTQTPVVTPGNNGPALPATTVLRATGVDLASPTIAPQKIAPGAKPNVQLSAFPNGTIGTSGLQLSPPPTNYYPQYLAWQIAHPFSPNTQNPYYGMNGCPV